MTQEELYRIYEEISDFIYNNCWRSYHIWYLCGSTDVISNNTIEFEVYGASDQGDGDEWIEHWSIDTNGKIYTEDNVYDNIEDFKRGW
jgi:hypothetical protein